MYTSSFLKFTNPNEEREILYLDEPEVLLSIKLSNDSN